MSEGAKPITHGVDNDLMKRENNAVLAISLHEDYVFVCVSCWRFEMLHGSKR